MSKEKKGLYQEVFVYIIFGVLTTLVNILSFYLFETILGWHYLWANATAIVVSIVFAFWTNKLFVFQSKTVGAQAWIQEFVRFASFRAVSGVMDMAAMWVLVSLLTVEANLAKIIVQVLVVVLNYFFSKRFVFK